MITQPRTVFGVLAVLVVVVGAWVVWRNNVALDARAPVAAAYRADPAEGGVSAAEPEGSAAVRAPVLSPRVEFERTDDLYAFLQKLSPSVNAGDSDALWLVSKVVDYCYGYGMNPAGFAADTDTLVGNASKEAAAAIKAARERMSSRCRGFAGRSDGNIFSRPASLVNKVRAAKAGSLAAEASLIVQNAPLSTDAAYLGGLTQRIARSGDPEAYLAISDAMGVGAAGRQAAYGANSGSEIATYAWQLAACRRGLNCSSTGALMSMYCVNGGVCGPYNTFEDLLFNGLLPGSDRSRVNEMTNRILSQQG